MSEQTLNLKNDQTLMLEEKTKKKTLLFTWARFKVTPSLRDHR